MKLSAVFIYCFILYLFLMLIYEILLRTLHLEMTVPFYFRMIIYIFGIVTHELIHGIFAAMFSPDGFKNIKFGFSFKSFIAYCNINENMKVKHFKIVAIMPFIILGIISFIFGIIIKHAFIIKFGILFSVGSIGDLIMFIWLCNEKNNYWIKDTGTTKKLEIIVFEK